MKIAETKEMVATPADVQPFIVTFTKRSATAKVKIREKTGSTCSIMN